MFKDNTNLTQWYECNNKIYYNYWQALYENKDNQNNWIEYYVDPELVTSLKGIKRPNTNPLYIQNLIVKKLQKLRNTYNEIRLLYSGGTDSYTILKLAIENDIYIDETITHMVSMTGNARLNLDYLFGLKYAKKHLGQLIGKVTEIHPKPSDYYYLDSEDWFKSPNIVKGNPIYIRPTYINQYLNKSNIESSITIAGYEKPQFYKEKNQIYWTILDSPVSECIDIPNLYHFFIDKNNPELIASQHYAMLDTLKSIPEGYFNFYVADKEQQPYNAQKIGLCMTGKLWLDQGLLGKKMFGQSLKNKQAIKELQKIGRQDIIDKIKSTSKKIYQDLKHIPYTVEYENGFSKAVSRLSQKIPIYQDSFGS